MIVGARDDGRYPDLEFGNGSIWLSESGEHEVLEPARASLGDEAFENGNFRGFFLILSVPRRH